MHASLQTQPTHFLKSCHLFSRHAHLGKQINKQANKENKIHLLIPCLCIFSLFISSMAGLAAGMLSSEPFIQCCTPLKFF